MSEEAAKGRAEAWLTPIPGASAAGEDARYDPLHEEIRAEAAKLDSPTTGMPNWEKLVKDAQKLTSTKSKDLLIESYAAYGLFQTEGLLGLAVGLYVLSESMDRFWEGLFPPAARLRARVNAISWLTERLDTTLPETPVGPNDHAAVEALDAAVKRLREVVTAKFADEAPGLRPVADAVERLKMSLPERAQEPSSDTEPPPPPGAEATAAPAASPAPAAEGAPPPAEAAPEAAPAPEPDEPAAPDYAADLLARAKPWIEPVPGDAPAGIDAKYELDHEELRNDITALDAPTGHNIDWVKVVPRAGSILKDKSKDLLIASYLAFALWETKQLDGLATGLEVITQICERYWEDCYPSVKRLRGRGNAVGWLLERIEQPLPLLPLTAKDKQAVEQLEYAVKRFADVVRDKFEDAAPSLRPLQDNVQRLKMSVPEPAPKAPPPSAPKAATPAAAAARPAAAPSASAGVQLSSGAGAALADPKEVGNFIKTISKSLVDAAKLIREAAPTDPTSYQFNRVALLLGSKAPPAEGGATKVPAPQDVVVKEFDTLLSNQNWEALLTKAELTLGGKRFWLDLHRYSALALTNLGKPYDEARTAVIAGAALWVKQMPELLDMSFAGGLPFASDLTKEWINNEVMPSGGGGGGGGGGDGEGADVLAKARSLAAGGKMDEALGALEQLSNGGRSNRARFRARLAMAQALSTSAATAAEGIFDALLAEIDAFGIDRWEPELAADCYRGHLACLRSLKKPNDPVISQQTALVYRRLCRVDPLAAVKVAG